MSTRTDSTRAIVAPLPTANQVLLLQSARGYPCVSLLMNTTPGSAMTPDDHAALTAMASRARSRLALENLTNLRAVTDNLDQAVAAAMAAATSSAIAVFASRALAQNLVLPVNVVERIVVDPSFATRDLVRSLHRMPRHYVLVLDSREARLFRGSGSTLAPEHRSDFPLIAEDDRARRGHRAQGRESSEQFHRRTDQALGRLLRLHPAPLILVGPQTAVASFERVSRNLGRLAGRVLAGLTTAPIPELSKRIAPILETYLLSRQDEALALLDERTGADRALAGMAAAWLAARNERPEMLAVEQGLFYPARVSADGDLLTPADDVEAPDVIDDMVDELIELVLDRGGWVALVDDGRLTTYDRVALTVRR